jgi:heat shock protein HslJ
MHRMLKRSIAFVTGQMLAILFACTTTRTPPPGSPLENITWRLVELNGQPALPGPSQNAAQLRFEGDSSRVTGSTGCNRLTGPYTKDGASLRFGPSITTRMACADPRLNEQEARFVAALQATERHQIERDTLTLLGYAGALARFASATQ